MSETKLSIFAVPFICKSFHCKADDPKSKALSTSGIKLELTSVFTTKTSIEPVSAFKVSIFAVPSKCKSLNSLVELPKS